MKTSKRIVSVLMCVFMLSTIFVNATDNSEEVYPGTPVITYESVTGDKLTGSTSVGERNIYSYSSGNWKEYLSKLETEGWKKVEENLKAGEEYVYTYHGYIVQINVARASKVVSVTVYKDAEGKYEVIDNSVITVYVNGQKLYFDVEPQLIGGRTMVPMRSIFEALDTKVDWDDENKKITATKESDEYPTQIEMQINSKTMKINGEAVDLDVAPTIIGGRTLVPVRAVSEALRVDVDWHSAIKAVDIYAEQPKTTVLYDEKNDIANSPSYLMKKYTKAGWTTNQKKYVTMYAEDGRTGTFEESQVEAQKTVGWYTEPVQRLYAPDKSRVFKKTEVAAQLNVGWYEEPVVYVYRGNESMVVKKSNVEKMKAQGWTTEIYIPHLSDFISPSTVIAKLYGTSVFIHNKSKYPLRVDGILIDDYSHKYGSQNSFEVIIAPGESRDLHFSCYRPDCKGLIHGSASQARLSVEVVRNEGFDYGGFLYFDINGIFDIF